MNRTTRPASARSSPRIAPRPLRTRPLCRCAWTVCNSPGPALPGARWLGDQLWHDLQLDTFAARLGCSREGTDWEKSSACSRSTALSPGSEWRLHRHWFGTTALADLLGVDERQAQDDTLYRGLDGLLEHKDGLLAHLRGR